MATNTGNSDIFTVTTKRTVPLHSTKTGTISSDEIQVTGVGTTFLADIKKGDWIVDFTGNEKRKVTNVASDTLLEIESEFTTDLAGDPFDMVPSSRLTEIGWLNSGGGAGEINGVSIPANAYGSWGKTSKSETESRNFIDPVIFDGTTSNFLVVTLQ